MAKYFLKAGIISLMPILLASCGVKPSKSAPPPAPVAGENSVNIREAFFTHLYPVLRENCVECHAAGAHPFVSGDQDTAIRAAQPRIGQSPETSRFYDKLVKQNHPNRIKSEQARLPIHSALKRFFESVKTGVTDGVQTEPLVLRDRIQTGLPELSPYYERLIFELEGGTISGKFAANTVGGSSNNLAVTSNIVPRNPDGTARTYAANTCSDNPPRVTELARTANDLLKISYNVDGVMVDPDTGEPFLISGDNVEIDGLFRILPNNYDPRNEPIPDSIYENREAPNTLTWNDGQNNAAIKKVYNLSRNRSYRNNSRFQEFYENTFKPAVIANKANVKNFFDISFNRIEGPVTIAYPDFDIETGDGDNPFSVNLHPNQDVDINTFDPGVIEPGKVVFRIQAPDHIKAEEHSLWIKSQGNANFRVQDERSGEYLRINNRTCNTLSSDNNFRWRKQNLRIPFEPGGIYALEFYQIDQGNVLDAAALVGNLSDNEEFNPNQYPHQIHTLYGLENPGEQSLVNYVEWPFDLSRIDGDPVPGKIRMEVEIFPFFYQFRAPRFIAEGLTADQSIFVDGFDFMINESLALTDKSFSIRDTRIPGAVASYTRAIVPTDKGPDQDQIALKFISLGIVNEIGNLPGFEIPPPILDRECAVPEVFEAGIWRLYSQQVFYHQDDYDSFVENTAYPVGRDDNQGLKVNTTYRCMDCHNADHELYPIPRDPQLACNEALARSNLQNPELSFAIRGLLGQFNHEPIYAAFDPFDGQKNFIEYTLSDGTKEIYGPMLGRLVSPVLADLLTLMEGKTPEQQDQIKQAMKLPQRKALEFDPETGLVIQNPDGTYPQVDITPLDGSYMSNASFDMRQSEAVDIKSQHSRVQQIYLEKFIEWIEAENEAAQD